jgi:hypothetical protein
MKFAFVRKRFKRLDLTPKQSSYVFGLNVNSFIIELLQGYWQTMFLHT